MFCIHCGSPHVEIDNFCGICGKPIVIDYGQPLSQIQRIPQAVDTDSHQLITAEQGDADAQTLLGVMYEDGEGVKQDLTQASKKSTSFSAFMFGKRSFLWLNLLIIPFLIYKIISLETLLKEDTSVKWQTVTVDKGQSLDRIFKSLGVDAITAYSVTKAQGENLNYLRELHVGDKIRVAIDGNNSLVEVEYQISLTETLYISLIGGNYQAYKKTKAFELNEAFHKGIIKKSFWDAGIESGLSEKQILNLANLFDGKVDFIDNLRKEDAFKVIYQSYYIAGRLVPSNKILVAEFTSQGVSHKAILFKDKYYTSKGEVISHNSENKHQPAEYISISDKEIFFSLSKQRFEELDRFNNNEPRLPAFKKTS